MKTTATTHLTLEHDAARRVSVRVHVRSRGDDAPPNDITDIVS